MMMVMMMMVMMVMMNGDDTAQFIHSVKVKKRMIEFDSEELSPLEVADTLPDFDQSTLLTYHQTIEELRNEKKELWLILLRDIDPFPASPPRGRGAIHPLETTRVTW